MYYLGTLSTSISSSSNQVLLKAFVDFSLNSIKANVKLIGNFKKKIPRSNDQQTIEKIKKNKQEKKLYFIDCIEEYIV